MNAFLTGMAAGYGIAIPIGAIALLIIEMGLREGFRTGFWAGAGAATADTVYATAAMALGSLAVVLLGHFAVPLKFASGCMLLWLGINGLLQVRVRAGIGDGTPNTRHPLAVYAQFLGLTILNPMTVVYFSALILGGASGSEPSLASRLLFVLGAGLASLSWQTLLAASASVFHKRLPSFARTSLSLVGNLIICAFGVNVLAHLLVTVA